MEDRTELICRFLPDWTLTSVNEAYCHYFGKSPNDLISRSFMSFVPHEDRQRVTDCMASWGATTPFLTIEHQVIANEELRWQQWTNRAVFDAAGMFCLSRNWTSAAWHTKSWNAFQGLSRRKA